MNLFKRIAIFFFDILDKYIHQKKILNFLKKNSVDIETFFDVGSHKGTYTDLIINNFNVKKTIMFEPQKIIFKFIKKKYIKNKSIIIYNQAVSDKKIRKTLHINKHDLTSSLSKLDKKNIYLNLKARLFGGTINDMIKKKSVVNSCKLSEIIKKNKVSKIDLLKIDTEGHELQVLKGVGLFLKKNVNYMLIEIHNSDIFLNYDSKKIHNYLKKNQFTLKKVFKFPFTTWEDRIYQNENFN